MNLSNHLTTAIERANQLRHSNPRRLFIHVITLLFITSIPFKDTIFQITIILLNLSFIYFIIKQKETSFFLFSKPLLSAFGLIFISMTLSNTFGIGGFIGWKIEVQFFIRFVLLFYALIYFIHKGYLSIKIIIVFITISLSLQLFDGLYQYFTGYDFFKHKPIWNYRITAVLSDPNLFGLVLMINIPIFISLSLNKNKIKLPPWQNILIVILTAVSFFEILYTASRAAWLGLVLTLVVYSVLNKRLLFSKRLLISGLFLTVAIVLYVIFDSNLNERIVLLLNGDTADRGDMWQFSLQHILHRPILGYGIGSMKTLISKPILDPGNYSMEILKHYSAPHNLFIEIQLYLGLIGSISFSYYIFNIFREIKSLKENKEIFSIILALFLGLLTIGQFDHSLITNKIYLSIWIILTAILFWYGKFRHS